MMENKYAPLEAEGYYHVYNRANGDEIIFRSSENYAFFLRQYLKYIHPFVDTFCYCLMPNHFHFLIQVKNQNVLEDQLKVSKKLKIKSFENKDQPKFGTLADLHSLAISKQFSNFFSSYTQALNKMYDRKGSLFMKPYKRKKIEDETYLKKLVHYIHFNPVKAGLVKRPQDWKHSSYRTIISSEQTIISKKQVIEIFEDQTNFIHCHQAAYL